MVLVVELCWFFCLLFSFERVNCWCLCYACVLAGCNSNLCLVSFIVIFTIRHCLKIGVGCCLNDSVA